MITAIVLLACHASKPPADSAAPYVVDEDALDLPSSDLDTDALASAVEEAFALIPTLDPAPLIDAYDDILALADASCPTWYTSTDGEYWYDDCVSEDGAHFQGYATSLDLTALETDDVSYTGGAAYGAATLTDPDGHALVMNGAIGVAAATEGGSTTTQLVLDGAVTWDGPSADDTWLSAGLVPQLQGYAVSYGQLRALIIDGAVSGYTGAYSSVSFDQVLAASEGVGAPCALEPSGTVSVRSAAGQWTEIVFDLPYDVETESFGEMDPADCDGCGHAWSYGAYVGEVCVDLAPLLDWDGSPWT